MIAIPQALSKRVSEGYFDLIKERITKRIGLYRLVLEVLGGGATENELVNSTYHWKAIVAAANFFLVAAHRLETLGDLPNLSPGNTHGWLATYRQTFQDILDHFEDELRLKAIILVSPEHAVRDDLDLQQLFQMTPGYPPGPRPVRDFVSRLIDYEGIHKHVAYTMARQLKVDCCPYCNRIPTHTIIDTSDKQLIRPAFDHFFSHKRHPFLALSFFNLVPSCYYCNSSLKSDREMKWDTHLNPFVDGYSQDCVFKVKFNALHPDISDPENFEITLSANIPAGGNKYRRIFGNTDTEGNNNLFKLTDIYQVHRDVAGELWLKAQRCSPAHQKALFDAFGLMPGEKERFYRFYFGNYRNEADFSRRPLSKLTHDLVRKLLPELFTS